MKQILSTLMRRPVKSSETLSLLVDEERWSATVRRHPRARKFTLRVDPKGGEIIVTMPQKARLDHVQAFLEEHIDWIKRQRAPIINIPPLASGQTVKFQGKDYSLIFSNTPPRRVSMEGSIINVGGPKEHAPGRLLKWFREQAKAKLTEAVCRHTETLGLEYNMLSVGDAKSRWGSCSASKNLRFSWRLVLAPPEILNYVAAHEVAHLAEMNHSPAFWALVCKCDENWKQHRAWLKREGQTLFHMARV